MIPEGLHNYKLVVTILFLSKMVRFVMARQTQIVLDEIYF